jgi:biopolymer transport protein ExbD
MAFASFDPRRTSAPMADINMVPLIDVMLVLLVIFIVTAPLLTHAVKLELPRASSTVNQSPPQKIEFAIDAAGQRFWNGEPVDRATVRERFTAEGRRRPMPEVHLRVDAGAEYRTVAETMADAANAGLTKIGFVTTPEQ